MKRIGFLSFGHWGDVPASRVRTARDALVQAIDLAVATEEVGVGGAYFRVHHFAEQQATPFPLLAAIAARTSGGRTPASFRTMESPGPRAAWPAARWVP
jgi:alkanesulfonate monooxygenase SsuD/methylene tetrahydromethanopterin reductase-like flavin-dependent oxidoreductase (luciferase family)